MAIEVHTTQNVIIDYEPASIGNRMLAAIIDYGVFVIWVLGWIGILFAIADNIRSLIDSLGVNTLIVLGVLFLGPLFFYHLLFEFFNNGQSIGKKVVKIRVIKLDGTPPSFGSCLLRWLFRAIDIDFSSFIAPGIIGIVSIISTKKSQRIGDIVAGTTVIDLKVYSKNKELIPLQLDFNDDYQVAYSNILSLLSDKDIQTITAIINDHEMKNSDYVIDQLTQRTKQITGYTYDGHNLPFLKKIVNDYNYLALQ